MPAELVAWHRTAVLSVSRCKFVRNLEQWGARMGIIWMGGHWRSRASVFQEKGPVADPINDLLSCKTLSIWREIKLNSCGLHFLCRLSTENSAFYRSHCQVKISWSPEGLLWNRCTHTLGPTQKSCPDLSSVTLWPAKSPWTAWDCVSLGTALFCKSNPCKREKEDLS